MAKLAVDYDVDNVYFVERFILCCFHWSFAGMAMASYKVINIEVPLRKARNLYPLLGVNVQVPLIKTILKG